MAVDGAVLAFRPGLTDRGTVALFDRVARSSTWPPPPEGVEKLSAVVSG
jgi:hypothetical protein